MCVQCAAGAMSVATGAVGARIWLVHRARAWMSPGTRRVVTAVLLAAGVLAAGLAA